MEQDEWTSGDGRGIGEQGLRDETGCGICNMFYLTCSSCRHLSMGNKHKNFQVIDALLPWGAALPALATRSC